MKRTHLMGYEADDHWVSSTQSMKATYGRSIPRRIYINQIGVRGIYLGNYIRWDPLAQHLKMVKEAISFATMPRTFDV